MLRFLIKMRTNKAQLSMEFIMLISIVFMTFVIFVAFVRMNYSEVNDNAEYLKVKDLALSIKFEFDRTIEVESGFQRGFILPATIDYIDYNVTKQSSTVILFSTSDAEYIITVPPFQGDIQKGNNIIKNIGGQIWLN